MLIYCLNKLNINQTKIKLGTSGFLQNIPEYIPYENRAGIPGTKPYV